MKYNYLKKHHRALADFLRDCRVVPASYVLKYFFDYCRCFRAKGLTLEEYYLYSFEKRDDTFRSAFLGQNEERIYLDLLNPKRYYTLSRNKFLAHKMLDDTGIRQPILYCYYQPEGDYPLSREYAGNLEGVLRILKSKNVCSFVSKATESSHGENIIVIRSVDYRDTDAELTAFNGSKIMLSELLGDTPLIFESIVRQSVQFASFNPSSVNTLRFMTALYPNKDVRLIAVFGKVGREGACVDNAGGGGNVDFAVDVESGRIHNVQQYDGMRNMKSIECHPDSHVQMEGMLIDDWDNIKRQVVEFQKAIPFCKAAGWDIAITDEGPVVVEVNEFWDCTGQLFWGQGWRNEIRDCYLAWRKAGKRYPIQRKRNSLDSKHLQRIIKR